MEEFMKSEGVATVEKPVGQTEQGATTNTQSEETKVDNTPEQGANAQKPTGTDTTPEKGIDDLTEEQFKKLEERIFNDKSPFHQNPAWKRIMSQRNGASQRAERAIALLAQKDPEAVKQLLIEEGMGEEDAQAYVSRFPKQPMQQTEKREVKEEKDDTDLELLGMLKKMGISPDQLTSEQLEFWKFQYKFNKQMMQPVNGFVEQTKAEKQKEAETRILNEMTKEEQELIKVAKDKYGLEWEQDVVPELKDYLMKHPQFIGTPKQLFSIVFFDKGEELGKRAKSIEDAKLNKEKKSANTEDGSTLSRETKPAGVGKNWNTTWDWVNRHEK